MIGTITLNPCIDKTIAIDGFEYGGMNRVSSSREDIAGKGINVSIALSQLERNVYTLGLDYKENSEPVKTQLQKRGIQYQSIVTDGTLRVNMKVMDQHTHITTEFNQKGDAINQLTLEQFYHLLNQVFVQLDILVIAGSVPPGVGTSCYYDIVKMANKQGIKVILDAEGELLLNGIKASPYLIKPNLYEFKTAFGLKSNDISDILAVCQKIIQENVEVICLSMGNEGAIIVDSQHAYLCRPSYITVQSTQGAGDSLVAGICIAIEEGVPLDEMLRYGVACAQGSLIKPGTLLCEKTDFEHFKEILEVETLN